VSTVEEEKKQLADIGLGRLLHVVATSDGYIETDAEGKERRYSEPTRDRIQIKNLNVFKSVLTETGVAHFYLHGVTATAYRPLGAEKAYVLDVVLSSLSTQNKATINVALQGHKHGFYNSFGFGLRVGLSQTAIAQVVEEARAAATPRDLIVVLAKPVFFEGGGSITNPVETLPYWGDQYPGKHAKNITLGERIELEWSFDVREVIVRPTLASSRVASEFDDRRDRPASVYAKGDIAIHGSPEREAAIKLAYEQLLTSIHGIRSVIILIAIAAIAIAVKMWLR